MQDIFKRTGRKLRRAWVAAFGTPQQKIRLDIEDSIEKLGEAVAEIEAAEKKLAKPAVANNADIDICRNMPTRF